MSSYRHSLLPEHGVEVKKIANISFVAPKPYLKGIYWEFKFDRKFCLVDILKP